MPDAKVATRDPVTLVADGHPVARIYVPADTLAAPKGPLAVAVADFNYHLERMSGARLVVSTGDPSKSAGPAIVLGARAVTLGALPLKRSASREGFRLLTRGNRVLIGGESDAAVLLGVEELLRRLGCDWVMPGRIGEIIPTRATVRLPALDEAQAPAFVLRRLNYGGGRKVVNVEDGARLNEWLRRMKGNDYRFPARDSGGHYWQSFIRTHQAAFDADSSLYALVREEDGSLQRRGPQLEATDPRIAAMMAQDIRNAFASKGWPKDKAVGFRFGPADGAAFSVSPQAIAASPRRDPLTGAPDVTDIVVGLGNRILADLGPDYPNVLLGYYSYFTYSSFPVRERPDRRIAVTFAPITPSRLHAITDTGSASQRQFRASLEAWSRVSRTQGNPLIYRGYSWNLADDMLPYSKIGIWGADIPYLKSLGILGLNIEAVKAWAVNGPSNWILMRLAWAPSADWHALLKEYCLKSYGRGAAPMERYFLRQIARQQGSRLEAGSYYSYPLLYDAAYLRLAQADMVEALRLADDPDQRVRIGYIADTLTVLDVYLRFFAAANSFRFADAASLIQALHGAWSRSDAENPDLVAREAPRYINRFLRPFADQAFRFSSPPYALAERLPDALPTWLDPDNSGERRGWAAEAPAQPPSTTLTYSSTWDAQGLSVPVGGAVWYRYAFKAPSAPANLFLGGFVDRARVWVNGTEVPGRPGGERAPAAFVLGSLLIPGQRTVLTIKISRTQATSETGVGGLTRPSFVFTAPPGASPPPSPAFAEKPASVPQAASHGDAGHEVRGR